MCLRVDYFWPSEYQKTIFDIDYQNLFARGFRLIMIDLDNTIISYKEDMPKEETFAFKKMLEEIGFEIILVSNSKKKRVQKFATNLDIKYVYYATKPLLRGYKKGIKIASRVYKKEEILTIGDQFMTDICGSRRLGLYTILVKPIDKKTERLSTKINRKWEKIVKNKLKKKDINKYQELLSIYEADYEKS